MLCSEAIKSFTAWRAFKVGKSTVKGYELYLRQFCMFIRNKHIEQIGLDDVIEYFNMMRELEWDQNSFMPKAIALRKFLEFYQKQGHKVLDPWLVPIPKNIRPLPRVATDDQYEKLLSAIPESKKDSRHVRNKAIIGLLHDTGARNGEICSLNRDDIDLQNKKAIIRTEKNQGSRPYRQIFWTDRTNEWLAEWIERRKRLDITLDKSERNALFISLCNAKSGDRLNVKGVGEMLRRYSDKAGLKGVVNAHSFRHKLGHDLVKNGANNSVISSILGHANLSSSFTYTQLNDKDLEEQYRLRGRK